VQVPSEYVKDGEIVLNVGFDATSDLHLGNDVITFKARFSGRVREIMIPVDHVVAIYARENGQGMAFPAPSMEESTTATPAASIATIAKTPQPNNTDQTPPPPPPKPPAGGRPKLKVIK
jgi:stringent starvation protein B